MPRVNDTLNDPNQPATVSVEEPGLTQRREGLRQALMLGLCLATLLAFAPALRNGFVNWDDDVNVVENAGFRGFGADRLEWMFTTYFGGHYQPLTWLSFAADHAVWQMSPFGYHLTNILLHMVAVVLFFLIALRLLYWANTGRSPAPEPVSPSGSAGGSQAVDTSVLLHWCAAFAAAIFALHPLRVESVAWVTERRDVLSAVLLFGSVLAYLRATDRQAGFAGWYGFSLALFALSLLSKASGMVLPVVLLVLDVYPLRRTKRGAASWGRLIAEKLPFLALGIAAAVVAGLAQQSVGTMRSLGELGIAQRLIIACYGLAFYVYKLITPTDLSPLYALPAPEALFSARYLLAGAAFIVVLGIAIIVRRRLPSILAALVAYAVLLAPVSGLAQSGKQLVADRYSYLSLLPFALLIAGALYQVYARRTRQSGSKSEARLFGMLAGIYVVGLALLTAAQTTVWHDSISLWDQAIEHNPESSVAQVNMADALRNKGHYEPAEQHYRKAVHLDGEDAQAHNGLGVTLLHLEQPHEALEQVSRAVELESDNPEYLWNLGYILTGFGEFEEAAAAYGKALDIAPGFTAAAEKLGWVLVQLERYQDAQKVLADALERSPGSGPITGQLAWLMATCPDAAVRNGERAVALAEELCRQTDYRDPWALDTLAAAYAEQGAFKKAVATAREAITLATQQSQSELVADLQQRLALYEHEQPYRLES